MAKAKVTPAPQPAKEDDGTITREEVKAPKAPATPKASDVEKTKSFTAAFKGDAHVAADNWLTERDEEGAAVSFREELRREESDGGGGAVTVTVTYK